MGKIPEVINSVWRCCHCNGGSFKVTVQPNGGVPGGVAAHVTCLDCTKAYVYTRETFLSGLTFDSPILLDDILDTFSYNHYPSIPKDDPIHQPAHYTQGKIEVDDFIADQKLIFRLGCVVKYICRFQLKWAGNRQKQLEDLLKCVWYIMKYVGEHYGDLIDESKCANPTCPHADRKKWDGKEWV